ncbi:MAG: hypothetical protein QG669_323 [Patescibacteria group bacterium]|jgi:hypothetical protein|nr:hypothetical protein [Patescibacteria group bacterium]MDQ5961931.1 hypothetical protein [Patescibacteria group bacterium]
MTVFKKTRKGIVVSMIFHTNKQHIGGGTFFPYYRLHYLKAVFLQKIKTAFLYFGRRSDAQQFTF